MGASVFVWLTAQGDTPGAFLGGGVRGWGQTPQGSGQGCLVDCGRGPWLQEWTAPAKGGRGQVGTGTRDTGRAGGRPGLAVRLQSPGGLWGEMTRPVYVRGGSWVLVDGAGGAALGSLGSGEP